MIKCTKKDGVVIIQVYGMFDFSCHQTFSEACEKVNNESNVLVDLSETTYLDSSALGMLILLRDCVNENKGSIILSAPNDTVNNALKVANFDRLFKIEQ